MAVIGIDMDGVICSEERTFDKPLATLIPGAVEAMRKLRAQGHTVVIYTARGWEQFRTTADWLARNDVPYDQLLMGKPIFDAFVDDRAIAFSSWIQANEALRDRGI